VVDVEAWFKEMGKWAVAYVMNQGGGKQRRTSSIDMLIVADGCEMLEGLLHQMKHAQTVGQAVVVRTRIGQVADAKLVDAPKALYLGRIEKAKQPLIPISIDADVVVQRVSKNLGGHGSPIAMTERGLVDELAGQFLNLYEKTHVGCRVEVLELARPFDRIRPVMSLLPEVNQRGGDFKLPEIGAEQFLGLLLERGQMGSHLLAFGSCFKFLNARLRMVGEIVGVL
jgi:hypothetical protein